MPITYISVFVVTVGSQENLGDFIHSAEEKRQLSLVGTEKKKGRKKSEAPRIFTNQSLQRLKQECVALCVCVCSLSQYTCSILDEYKLLTSLTTYFSKFSTVFSFRVP